MLLPDIDPAFLIISAIVLVPYFLVQLCFWWSIHCRVVAYARDLNSKLSGLLDNPQISFSRAKFRLSIERIISMSDYVASWSLGYSIIHGFYDKQPVALEWCQRGNRVHFFVHYYTNGLPNDFGEVELTKENLVDFNFPTLVYKRVLELLSDEASDKIILSNGAFTLKLKDLEAARISGTSRFGATWYEPPEKVTQAVQWVLDDAETAYRTLLQDGVSELFVALRRIPT